MRKNTILVTKMKHHNSRVFIRDTVLIKMHKCYFFFPSTTSNTLRLDSCVCLVNTSFQNYKLCHKLQRSQDNGLISFFQKLGKAYKMQNAEYYYVKSVCITQIVNQHVLRYQRWIIFVESFLIIQQKGQTLSKHYSQNKNVL